MPEEPIRATKPKVMRSEIPDRSTTTFVGTRGMFYGRSSSPVSKATGVVDHPAQTEVPDFDLWFIGGSSIIVKFIVNDRILIQSKTQLTRC